MAPQPPAPPAASTSSKPRPGGRPLVVPVQGRGSILSYFSSSPQLGRPSSAATAPPTSSSPAPARARAPAAAAASASSSRQHRDPLRTTHSLSALEPGPSTLADSSRHRATRSTSTAAAAAPAPSAAAPPRRASPRMATTPSGSVTVKRENTSPVKRSASRVASATPVPAHDPKGKGKAKATPSTTATKRAHKTIVIPDSSSEGEGGSTFAKEVLARSSPRKRVRSTTSAATLSSLEHQHQRTKRKTYQWTRGTNGRDELDLTVASSPSAASTVGHSDSDADSEIIVVPASYSLKGKQRAADASRRTDSLTPRASASTATKPKAPVGSPLVKRESLSSAGLGPSPSPVKPKVPPALVLNGGGTSSMRLPKAVRARTAVAAADREREGTDAHRMPPPPSPARASTSGSRAASRAPVTPSRRATVGAVAASVGRSGAAAAAVASGGAGTRAHDAAASPSHKRVRSLSQSSSSSRHVVVEVPISPARSVRGGAGPSAAAGLRSPVASSSSTTTSTRLPAPDPAASAMLSPRHAPAAAPSTPRPIAKMPSARTASGGGDSPSTASASTAAPAPPTASSSKLTASALRAVPPRTPQHPPQRTGPQLIRTPSGSPLSSLAPTPQKPRFTHASTATGSGTGTSRRKGQPFEIVIPPIRRRAQSTRARSLAAPSAASASASVSASARRKALSRTAPPGERGTGHAREWTRRQERDAATSEWDAFVNEDEGSSGSDGEEGEGAGSPSPAKKARRDMEDAVEGRSSSSSSSSSASDAGDDSDADDFAALLAAARAKREANVVAGIVDAPSASNVTSPHTAKTTVSPPLVKGMHDDDDERRHSSRARRQPDRYSTSTAASAATPARASASTSKQGSGVPVPASLNLIRTTGLDEKVRRIVAEREAKDKKGRGAEWLEAWGRELDKGDDDAGLDDDDLDNRSDDSLPPLDTSLVSRALKHGDDTDDDDLPAPSRAAASKRAQAVERVLLEERGAERLRAGRGETVEEMERRRVLPTRETRMPQLETGEWQGEGWRGKVAQALKDAVKDPRSFPSAFTLYSNIRPNGSAEDDRVVAQWLTTAITHPSTSTLLADRLLSLLRRIVSHTSPDGTSLLVGAGYLGERLTLLGAWKEEGAAEDGLQAMDEDEAASGKVGDGEDSTLAVGESERREIIDRWSSILQILSGTSSCLFSDGDLKTLSLAVIGLMLDQSSASSRSTLGRALQSLLASLSDDSRVALLVSLVNIYGDSRPALHLAVLQAIPHTGEANKGLRRWLAWAFLSGVDGADIVTPVGGLSPSTLANVLSLLDALPDKSPLHRRSLTAESGASTARDLALADCTRILFVALTSLDVPLVTSPSRLLERQNLDAIISHLSAIDSRLRADARKGLAVERLVAKNLLTALTHSLTHQLRGARGQTGAGAFGFSEEEESALKREREADGTGREAKRARTEGGGAAVDGAGFKQSTLAFGTSGAVLRAAAGLGEVDGAAARSPTKSDDEVEEELVKL
ncbi:uncharacterized protein RHOBADRAFT_51590 [Rhodotorula graminis WP1]|uniref:Uncharacterized protein n=1 Tax=Rhodotorula graminis (strain WP1) TaxID=578459 RepID=A0A194SB08_RHOGW|nr:uncharacterized protein RHOBADRAFT_51590 [Rhodotorula graminis WP1]KPV77779.1 hypothetical protein RHOBADRAFT_51590 [Rhodotorula graminis WP1]